MPQQIPPEMLSQLLAAQDNGPSASRAQMPPLSLLAPQLATATSRSSVAAAAAADDVEMQPAGTSSALSNTSLEEQQQQKDEGSGMKSHYVSLQPKSQTKLVNPQQSMYATNSQREQQAKKQQKDEKK